MNNKYLTLTGEEIDLSDLSVEQKLYIGEIIKEYRSVSASYPNFFNLIHKQGSVAMSGKDWIDSDVLDTPLYKVCQDLSDRLGIAQGFLKRGENSSQESRSDEPEMISVSDAAKCLKISSEAIRKAIREGRLLAEPFAKRSHVLKRSDVLNYMTRRRRV